MLKKLRGSSDFLRSTLILILGTGLGQAIPLLLQPVLRRVYTPEDFGAFAIYFSLFGILTVIANFRYDLAIGLPKRDEDGVNLFFLTAGLNFLFNFLVFFIILFFKHEIAGLIRFPERLVNMLFLLPLSMFLFCLFQSVNYWLIRKKAFRSISVNKISRRGAEGVVQTGFGLLNNPAGLFWGDLAGNLSNTFSGIWQLKKTGFNHASFSKEKIIGLARTYSHFPKYNLLPHLLGTIAMQYPVFIISRMFTKADLGFFDLTQQAILFPFALITVAVSQVLLQKVTENRNRNQSVLSDFYRVSMILGAIGMISLVLIEFFGPVLYAFIFGAKWAIAGSYSRILIIGYIFFLIASPMNSVLISLEKIRTLSLWNLIHFLLMIMLGFIRNIDFPTFLKLFTVVEILSFSTFYLLTLRMVLKFEKQIKKI